MDACDILIFLDKKSIIFICDLCCMENNDVGNKYVLR